MNGNTKTMEFLRKLSARAFTPNVDAIVEIIARGHVAVVIDDIASGLATDAARKLGWDGVTAVFELPIGEKNRLMRTSAEMADHVTANWLRGKRDGRVFVMTGKGTLLVNLGDGGYSLEPGSTQRAAA